MQGRTQPFATGVGQEGSKSGDLGIWAGLAHTIVSLGGTHASSFGATFGGCDGGAARSATLGGLGWSTAQSPTAQNILPAKLRCNLPRVSKGESALFGDVAVFLCVGTN